MINKERSVEKHDVYLEVQEYFRTHQPVDGISIGVRYAARKDDRGSHPLTKDPKGDDWLKLV